MKNKTFRGGEDTMDRKILIVDDEKNIVDIIAFNLKKEGYTVITAAKLCIPAARWFYPSTSAI